MTHTHGNCCKHLDVRYCQKCNVPYCDDCGKQWYEECKQSHGWYNYPYTIGYDSTTTSTPVNTCTH